MGIDDLSEVVSRSDPGAAAECSHGTPWICCLALPVVEHLGGGISSLLHQEDFKGLC